MMALWILYQIVAQQLCMFDFFHSFDYFLQIAMYCKKELDLQIPVPLHSAKLSVYAEVVHVFQNT